MPIGRLRQTVVRGLEAHYRVVDLAALALEMIDLGRDLRGLQLLFEIIGGVLRSNQFRDLGQRESQLFALDDHLQTETVDAAVQPHRPLAAWPKQASVLIETQSSEAHAEFGRHFADRRLAGRFALGRAGDR